MVRTSVGDNDDLIVQILERLPANSLIRFKGVCKQWESLISANNFSRFWITSPKRCGLFLTGSDLLRSKFLYLDGRRSLNAENNPFFGFSHPNYTILQSRNGLLLCTPEFYFHGNYTLKPNISCFVCNPATKRGKEVALLGFWRDSVYMISLLFDPKISPHYKVLCLFERGYTQLYGVKVYSSETRSWRLSGASLYRPHRRRYPTVGESSQVLWNGVFYWMMGSFINAAVCYDIAADSLEPMELPPSESLFLDFSVCNEHLCLVGQMRHEHAVFTVHEMEEEGSLTLWSLKCIVDLWGEVCSLWGLPTWVQTSCVLLGVAPDEGCKELSLVVYIDRQIIISYSLATKKVEVLYDVPSTASVGPFIAVHEYIESLSAV